MRFLLPLLCLLLPLLAACHDAKRDNLFDPQLTPAVELSVALDDTAGTATLTWTEYAGEAPFAEYRVLRKVQGLVAVDTLAAIHASDSTHFSDTALQPDTAYEYRVAVVNADGFLVESAGAQVAGFGIEAVRLAPVDADVAAGVLTVRWQRYRAPDFAGYRLVRQLVGTDQSAVVFESNGAVPRPNSGSGRIVDACRLPIILYTLRTNQIEHAVSAQD